MQANINWLKSNHAQLVQDLADIVAIQSVSTDGKHQNEISQSAELTCALMKKAGLENTEILVSNGSNPYAYGEWIGDPKLEFLAEVSPVNFAAKIVDPLLIVQGKEDRTVPPKQARKLIAALEKAGHPPQTIYFANEGHSFREAKTREKLYMEIEKFLAQHLAAK